MRRGQMRSTGNSDPGGGNSQGKGSESTHLGVGQSDLFSSTQAAPWLHEDGSDKPYQMSFLFQGAGQGGVPGTLWGPPSQVNSSTGLLTTSCHTLKPQRQKPTSRSPGSDFPNVTIRTLPCRRHACVSPAKGKAPQTGPTSAPSPEVTIILTLLLVLFFLLHSYEN